MRISLSWLESECGWRPDRPTLLDWLTEAGADASPSGADAIEITGGPGRAHLSSVRGLAAEVRGRAGLPPGPVPELPPGPALPIEIDDDLAARVAAVSLTVPDGVRLPEAQTRRLRDAGVEVTGTLADLLEYVELETGQPVGAVDAGLVSAGGLRLRSATRSDEAAAGPAESGPARLPTGSPLLTSGERVLDLPGRRGQPARPVPEGRQLVLYAWWLAPDLLRAAGRRYGPLADDDTIERRTGRGQDPRLCDLAVARTVELVSAWSQVTVDAVGAAGRAEPTPLTMVIHADALRHGVDPGLTTDRIVALLRAAGMTVRLEAGGALHITAPLGRPDVDRAELVAAEVARMHGYRAVPARLPPSCHVPRQDEDRALRRRIRDTAVRGGLHQVITPVLGGGGGPPLPPPSPPDPGRGRSRSGAAPDCAVCGYGTPCCPAS